MYIPGHIAFSYLTVAPYRGREVASTTPLWFVFFGSLFPDLLDKGARLIGLTPYGRTVGHSVVFSALLLLLTTLLVRRRSCLSGYVGWFAIGVATHLLADLYADVEQGIRLTGYIFSAWFLWPWKTPDDWPLKLYDDGLSCSSCLSGGEWVVILLAMWIAYVARERTFVMRPDANRYGWVRDALRGG